MMREQARPLRTQGFVGIATALLAIGVTAISPAKMGTLPEGLQTPVLAFEIAERVEEIETMFGAAGSAQRARFRQGMQRGTWLDFGLLSAYGTVLAGIAWTLGTKGAQLERPLSPGVMGRARVGAAVAVLAALLDALENRELLLILDALAGSHQGSYQPVIDRLELFVWPKWLLLGAWFALLAPALMRQRGFLRAAAIVGVFGAAASLGAFFRRGVLAELMAAGIALGMVLLVPGCFQKLAPESRAS